MTTTKGRPRGAYSENSVRSRLMDLLETTNGEWLTLRELCHEYSERFGYVKMATLRRNFYRIRDAGDVTNMKIRMVPIEDGKAEMEILTVCVIDEEDT